MNLLTADRVLADMDNNIDKVNIAAFTTTLIITKNRSVIKIVPIGPDDDLDKIANEYFLKGY